MLTRGRSRVIVALAALGVAAGTARLGVWQLDRAAQKIALQRTVDDRGVLPPLAVEQLARTPAEALAQYQRRVVLVGRWSVGRTVYLDNRQRGGLPGFDVLTPFLLADDSAVVVQRGWQPRDRVDRSRVVEVPTSAGQVELLGRIAPPPARLYEFKAPDAGLIRQNLDLAAYARETGLALRPLSVQQLATPSLAADGLQRDWPAPALDVQRNYGYAFQWFALSALSGVLYVWYQVIRPWQRRRAP